MKIQIRNRFTEMTSPKKLFNKQVKAVINEYRCRHFIIVPDDSGIVKKGQSKFCKNCQKHHL